MKEIRVLVISHMYPKKPLDVNVIHQQLKQLLREKCQVRVLSPVPYAPRIFWTNARRKAYGQVSRSNLIDGIPIEFPRYIRAPGSWFHGISGYTMYKSVSRFGKFDSIIKEFNPDILHTYAATPDGYAGLMLKKKYRIPFVCSLLGSDINVYPDYRPFGRKVTRQVISGADQLVAVSHALKTAAKAITQPKHAIQIVYMGVDLDNFRDREEVRTQFRAKLGILPKEVVLLFVGGLLKAKGVLDLIDAFTQLYNHYRNLRLVFVGDGSARGELRRRISELHIEDKVHIVGEKPHEEIPCWLSASDIFVLPSHREGLPNVVLEAMSCRRPVIATRVGGIPEAVEDGVNGILVDKGDVVSLAKTIAYLTKDELTRRIMGRKGRQIVSERFTWKKSGQTLREVYDKVLSNI